MGPCAGRGEELIGRHRPTVLLLTAIAPALLLALPYAPATPIAPIPWATVPFATPGLSANATLSDSGGSWNCGQGSETFAFFGRAIGGMAPYRYLWEFGDGTPNSTQQDPVHTYTTLGNFEVTLRITDVLNTSAITSLRPSWVAPLTCSNAPPTYEGAAVYAALVSVVGVGIVWYVVRRRGHPPPPPLG